MFVVNYSMQMVMTGRFILYSLYILYSVYIDLLSEYNYLEQ